MRNVSLAMPVDDTSNAAKVAAIINCCFNFICY